MRGLRDSRGICYVVCSQLAGYTGALGLGSDRHIYVRYHVDYYLLLVSMLVYSLLYF